MTEHELPSGSTRKIPPSTFRKDLLSQLPKLIEDWRKLTPLEHGETIDSRVSILKNLVKSTFNAILSEDSLKSKISISRVTDWEIEKKHIKILRQEAKPFKINRSTNRNMHVPTTELAGLKIFDEQNPQLIIWLPNTTKSKEIILLCEVKLTTPTFDTEKLADITSVLGLALAAFQSTDYMAIKSNFFSMVKNRIPTLELADICQQLIYYETWEIGNNQMVSTLDSWIELLPKKPLEINNKELDYLLSTYLTSLLYVAKQGNIAAQERLNDVLTTILQIPGPTYKTNQLKVHIREKTYLTLLIGDLMFRSRCVIAEALTYLPHIMKNKTKVNDRYGLAKAILDDIEQKDKNSDKARLLAAQCNIIGLEAQRIRNGYKSSDLTKLISDTHKQTNKILPLIQEALSQKQLSSTYPEDQWIELSSRWLDAWLGVRLIEEGILPGKHIEADKLENFYANFSTYDPVWLMEMIEYWVGFFHYLLSYFVLPQIQTFGNGESLDLPTEPENSAADRARLVLLCEWAHTKGVPRTLPIEKWLTNTYESELALYALSGKGSYRQHLFHVQDECLLGCVLLYSHWENSDETYLEKLASASSDFDEKSTKELLLCNWFVAALLHDIGYTLQVIPHSLDALSGSAVEGLDGMVEDINQRLNQMSNKIADYDPTATRAGNNLKIADHAHVSMATMLSHLRALPDQWQTASKFNQAAAAIIDHSSQHTPIDYGADPLSALIVICDQLQDWGRPRLDSSALAKNFLSNLRRPSNEQYELPVIKELFTSSHLYVEASLDTEYNLIYPNSKNTKDQANTIRFLLAGPEAGQGGYEPAVAWLDVCRSFQRIRPLEEVDLPLPHIQVALQHIVANDGIPELHRLSRFAYDNPERYGTLLDWLMQVRIKEQTFINYGCNEQAYREFIKHQIAGVKESAQYEWIEYTIPMLNNNENRPLKSLPKKLYRSYHKYRNNSEAK